MGEWLGVAGVLVVYFVYMGYRLYTMRQFWWQPYKDSIDIAMFGKPFDQLTMEERKAWRKKKKVLTWNGKKIF